MTIIDKIGVPTTNELIEAKAHWGHLTKRWHPFMEKYIVQSHNKFHVINPRETQKALRKAMEVVYDIISDGGQLLVVNTKAHTKQFVRDEARRANFWYVEQHWMGGMLTNFQTFENRIGKLIHLENEIQKTQKFEGTKQEETRARNQIKRLNKFWGGIKEMSRLPDVVFIVDIDSEATAVNECKILNIPTVAMVDTNSDPSLVDYPIPANDDSLKSITLILSRLTNVTVEARKEYNRRRELQISENMQRAKDEPKEEAPVAKTDAVKPENGNPDTVSATDGDATQEAPAVEDSTKEGQE